MNDKNLSGCLSFRARNFLFREMNFQTLRPLMICCFLYRKTGRRHHLMNGLRILHLILPFVFFGCTTLNIHANRKSCGKKNHPSEIGWHEQLLASKNQRGSPVIFSISKAAVSPGSTAFV
jgi:hypothetical protein